LYLFEEAMPKRGVYPSHRIKRGNEEKYCGHCDRWRLLKHFYFSKTKRRHIHPCKECRARETHPDNGWIFYQPTVEAWLRVLVNRVGKAEAARLCGWNKSRISKYLGYNHPRFVQRGTARLVLQALRDVEAADIVISRNSIKRGDFERGNPVRFARTNGELYNNFGDLDVEQRRRNRRADRQTDRDL
jgi:hypothetical protein